MFCSQSCIALYHKLGHGLKRGWMKVCPHCGVDYYVQPSNDAKFCNRQCYLAALRKRLGHPPEYRRHRPPTQAYKHWRKAVFVRDGYTCQVCGVKGNPLNAHHVNSWTKYEDLREDVDNGITFCRECHLSFHSKYGRITDSSHFVDHINSFQEDVP